jgi:hypothetical protein
MYSRSRYTGQAALASPEDIKNSFTLYRMSDACADLWKETVKDSAGAGKRGTPFDYSLIYPYYRALMQMPGLKPWALFALFQRGASQQWALLILSCALS